MIAQEAWDEFLETATANGSTENGAIDLYDIDGMVQAAHSLFKMADIAAAELARVTAELDETQTQVGDWIVRTDEANVRADAAEAKLAEREAQVERLRACLEKILGVGHDCPATFAGDEADWERVRSRLMQAYARAALSDIKGAGE